MQQGLAVLGRMELRYIQHHSFVQEQCVANPDVIKVNILTTDLICSSHQAGEIPSKQVPGRKNSPLHLRGRCSDQTPYETAPEQELFAEIILR